MYSRWCNMKHRCSNQNFAQFKDYGGRGIAVCERWRNSFDAYVEDLGLAPSKKHTVDRIDNDKPYCPENCRWAARKEQAINRRCTVWLELNGERKTTAEWGRQLGFSMTLIKNRLVYGWSIEKALTTPVIKKKALVKISACGA